MIDFWTVISAFELTCFFINHHVVVMTVANSQNISRVGMAMQCVKRSLSRCRDRCSRRVVATSALISNRFTTIDLGTTHTRMKPRACERRHTEPPNSNGQQYNTLAYDATQ